MAAPKLRLGKLPDRTSVRITIAVSPALNHALNDYVRVYHQHYGGQKEKVEDLIPFMLDRFIDGDADFKKARREMNDAEGGTPASRKT